MNEKFNEAYELLQRAEELIGNLHKGKNLTDIQKGELNQAYIHTQQAKNRIHWAQF